jgi:hypothetical protein
MEWTLGWAPSRFRVLEPVSNLSFCYEEVKIERGLSWGSVRRDGARSAALPPMSGRFALSKVVQTMPPDCPPVPEQRLRDCDSALPATALPNGFHCARRRT